MFNESIDIDDFFSSDEGVIFTLDEPKKTGVYLIANREQMKMFLDGSIIEIDDVEFVFVKQSSDGSLYAATFDEKIQQKDFYKYAWAKKCELN